MARVRESRARLARLVARLPAQRARIAALLASADKREATLQFEALKKKFRDVPPDKLAASVWPALERARLSYDEAFVLDPGAYWAVVQYLSLTIVIRHGGRLPPLPPSESSVGKLWALAEVQSLRDAASDDYTRRAWAFGNLIELYMLAPVIPEVLSAHAMLAPPPDWPELAERCARQLAQLARPGNFEIFSTRRQIVRYVDLYAELCRSADLEPAVVIAERVAELLPAEVPEEIARG